PVCAVRVVEFWPQTVRNAERYGRRRVQFRGERHTDRSAAPNALPAQHQCAQAVLAYDRGIQRGLVEQCPGLEEIGWIKTQCYAVSKVDAAGLQVRASERLPSHVAFTEVIANQLPRGNVDAVFLGDIESVAERSRQTASHRPLVGGVEAGPILPVRRRRCRQGYDQAIAR